ncbi:MAG TPA: hypothetical protein VN736_04090 [Candidatus Limnocylindrales bacterium]|nr:hypothetical protein [Candidatus Limnocylindrales bacterium]
MFRRFLAVPALLAAWAAAAPPLTTIQDVLYKADGTRFNGTLTIAWNSFQAPDNSTIVTQSTTVKVTDGNLRVQLVPTIASTAASYTVTYHSDGHVQFQETWQVPTSGQPLHVRDVRVVLANPSDGSTAAGDTTGTTAVTESTVVGLIADLGARPVKGPSYAAGRTAVVDPTGMLSSASGNASDCVHVDGSSGPCGGTAPSFIDGDSPTGIVDGSNTTFGLSAVPDPVASLSVYRNGILQKAGLDYSLSGSTIQFTPESTPQPADTLLASYRSGTADAAVPAPYTSTQVLCSGAGASNAATTLAPIGSCNIPAGLLAAGDRIEIRFDLAHPGATSGFSFAVQWGATTLFTRTAGALDALVAGRADVSILPTGAQASWQSWGSALPFAAGVAAASDGYSTGLTLSFLGTDSAALGNFSVVRIP